MNRLPKKLVHAALLVAAVSVALAAPAAADVKFNDDVIICGGSLCVGFDCVNGESFGFDTVRLKENNLRQHWEDTSTSASFPPNDWRQYANDSSNGGSSYYGIEDTSAGRFVFRIFAGARSNAMNVDSGGELGLGTTTPVADVHIKVGDSPTLRLEQDGTSGFTPQTWDVVGNEANFFVRDATTGSRLPFRIRPGALTSSIDIDAQGDVGFNTSSPETNAQVHIVSDGGNRGALRVSRNGNVALVLEDTSATDVEWTFGTSATGDFNIALTGTGVVFQIDQATGEITCPTGNTINGVACTGL